MAMARIQYASLESDDPAVADFLQRLQATRGKPSHIFLALAQAPALGEGVLAMATALRTSRLLSRRLRELAVLAVAIETRCAYELLHHWKTALDLGLTQGELEALPEHATSTCFTEQDRSVVRFALELTRHGKVSDAAWEAVEHLGEHARLELVLTVAWYNAVARMAHALDLDVEPWFDAPQVPALAFE
jgi:AhpD family alkylhydroperoxidase